MTENVKKIIEEFERLSPREQAQLRKALAGRKKRKGKKFLRDFLGRYDGGKALYSRLDRESIYEK